MKKTILTLLTFITLQPTVMAQHDTIQLRVIGTSDVHGCFFPYDFINRKPLKGSLARVVPYVDSLRNTYGDRLILLDNGDILQGQPSCYYANYVKPERPNVAAKVVNYMKYDAQTVGNHDIETGHAVYDKWISEVKCPMLGANVIDVNTQKPYLQPYTILHKGGIKVAVLGLITPTIPFWLTESIWSGMAFEDMVVSARRWMDVIRRDEKPDVVIGLFHSGWNGGIVADGQIENATETVAGQVPGFDLIVYGHDHISNAAECINAHGQGVVCLNPSANARMITDATITVTTDDRGNVTGKKVEGRVVNTDDLPVSEHFMKHFTPDIDSVRTFVDRKIGEFDTAISSRDSYFGSSAFNDFIHNIQLKVTHADVSFNAPLNFNARIDAGPVYVGDLFKLYRYENTIYTMRLTGREIRQYLEMSYGLWVNTMKSKDDHIILLDLKTYNDKQRMGFKNLSFNFDSAAGIDYLVDVTKPAGQRITILHMSNGEPFDEKKDYKVAINSYRGNGGGELLTLGAGIGKAELRKRIIAETPRDQRHYIMKEIEDAKVVSPKANDNWRFVPEEWAIPAIERDKQILFGNQQREE